MGLMEDPRAAPLYLLIILTLEEEIHTFKEEY